MTLGARLRLARARAGLSMRDLGKRAGVSAMAISKFERGEMTPRQATLVRLARALSVKPGYFFRNMTVDRLDPAFRKKSRLGRRAQVSIEAEIIHQLERHLEIHAILHEDGSVEEPSIPQFHVESMDDVEDAAERLRGEWELGLAPVEHIVGQLEDHSVKVIAVTAPKEFDGLSCWANGAIPVIAFNDNLPGDRQRFTVAHELGHLVLQVGHGLDPEASAHRFAAAFLVPRNVAIQELGSRRSNLDLNELRMLKREYGMSVQSWVRRAYDLGIIDRGVYQKLFIRIGSLGWRACEPDPLPSLQPRKLRLLVYQALAENLVTPAYAAYLLDEGPTRMRDHPSDEELEQAAEEVAEIYASDPELTEFTEADFE